MPDQPQILEKEQTPEKAPTVNHTHKESVKVIPLKSTKLELEKELESLILRYTNLKSKHEEELCEMEDINKRLKDLLQYETDLDKSIGELKKLK
ncbi:hypothetical protein DAPPUDRAFT_264211 [Daphnia pulex]|uniref:Uncharacterized protein n=1 Tax=Daphnia pulex TaxID=6669 RepID=E9HR34_DAPPU|nr:hypothetical protein DAPPUDRAFT_264211 [Daphnia pulex]|eukprot:EFX65804.1 hypothetical protein DAPPUDRAFT_264211 [Daphnia pulex]